MYLLGWCVHTLLKAELTHGMRSSVAVADTFPSSAITSLSGRVSVVTFVALGFQLGVFLTETTVSKIWTAGIGTGPFWSSWQMKHLLVGIIKALQDLCPTRLL